MAKILIIDDNAIMRKNVWFILKRENHTVLEAEDGPIGIALARAERPDLVLLDFMLPYMSGEAVAKYFCEHEDLQHIPVVMVTAVNQRELIMSMLKLNIQGYLLKPIKADVLRERVASIIGNSPPAEPAPHQEKSDKPEIESTTDTQIKTSSLQQGSV